MMENESIICAARSGVSLKLGIYSWKNAFPYIQNIRPIFAEM